MPTVPTPAKTKMPEGYVKAKLAIEGGETIEALFNPTEFTITKGNNWTFDPIKGTSLPTGKFGGGKPREMQVNLLLDRSLPNEGMSVKDITDKLFKMMEVPAGGAAGGAKSVPPLVTFQWGEMIPFKAACTSLTIAFQLFQPNGSPIRADVKLALTQAETATSASSKSTGKKTNPTTRSEGGLGVHVVRDGDTLQSIAHKTYDDPGRWRTIAEANGVDNPLHLRRGSSLNLPRID
jgi:Contractile injection system tube protein/LysM domain